MYFSISPRCRYNYIKIFYSLRVRGTEKMAPLPVPTHRRLQITASADTWRGDRDRKPAPDRDRG